MTNQEYIMSIAAELLTDPEWKLPAELRFFLAANLEWALLGL